MVNLIDQERDGTIIDQDLVRSCVTLYEAMGMNTLEAYSKDFETPLLEATRSFYLRRTAEWVQNDPTPVYLTKLEAALESEKVPRYTRRCLHVPLLDLTHAHTPLKHAKHTHILVTDSRGDVS
jgi:hypothetical protein